MEFTIKSIGTIHSENGRFYIKLGEEYKPGLTAIEGFSHLQVIWWGHLFDEPEFRENLVGEKPYKRGPEKIGVFSTRSQFRPNPVLITTIFVESIDQENGIIYTPYIDAEDGTPLLDIKPYHLYERVRESSVPDWCGHWPKWNEDSGTFDWSGEFNFE